MPCRISLAIFMDSTELMVAARTWAQSDLEESTAREMLSLIEAGDIDALRANMSPALAFGTAGLRGVVGPGPARMNASVVARVSWALGNYLIEQGKAAEGVVIGYDARPDSERFARLVAEVLSGYGVSAYLLPRATATPCAAYLVRKKCAAAGVVVTASHNPRGENGLKVFDGDGVQIVAPWDEEIARRITKSPVPRELRRNVDHVHLLSGADLEMYFKDVELTAEALVPLDGELGPLILPYSPLHGVGLEGAQRVLAALGAQVDFKPVVDQEKPDGTFPTVFFPNPEEPESLTLLLQAAKDLGAEAAMANDPDADRFLLCLPLGGGELVPLSGDALGLLFAYTCLRNTRLRNPEVISTIVSSPGIGLLAERYGARMTRTLTGFKWLCHAALESDAFLFAYEEALGYCFAAPSPAVTTMDKDGLLALLVATRLLLQKGGGAGLAEHLLGLYQDIGLWGSFGHSRRFEGADGEDRMNTQMDRLRESPSHRLGGLLVSRQIDYREHGEKRAWYLGSQDLLRFDLEADSESPEGIISGRVLVRPSGTEPKLKAYVHLRSELPDKSEYAEKIAAQSALARIIARQVLRRPESVVPLSARAV
jgi:phosphomannomutase